MIRLARWGRGTGLGKEGLGEKLIGQSWCQKPEALVTSGALGFHGSPSTYRDPKIGRDTLRDTSQLLTGLQCGSRIVPGKCVPGVVGDLGADLPRLGSDSVQGAVSVLRWDRFPGP